MPEQSKYNSLNLYLLYLISRNELYELHVNWRIFCKDTNIYIYLVYILYNTTYNYTALRAGQPSGRSSNSGSVKKFYFSKFSRPALGPTKPPVPGGSFPGGKAAGA
jgi:hypothetical protein